MRFSKTDCKQSLYRLLLATISVSSIAGFTGCKKADEPMEQYSEQANDDITAQNGTLSEESELKQVNGDIVDRTGEGETGDMERYRDSAKEAVDKFCSVAFNMKDKTEDYTDELISLCADYDELDTNRIGNIYPELHGIHMTSKYENFEIKRTVVQNSSTSPEVTLIGFVKTHMQSDRNAEGDYAVFAQFSVRQEETDWKITQIDLAYVYSANPNDGGYGLYESQKGEEYIKSRGPLAFTLDLQDLPGFLTNYSYGVKESK